MEPPSLLGFAISILIGWVIGSASFYLLVSSGYRWSLRRLTLASDRVRREVAPAITPVDLGPLAGPVADIAEVERRIRWREGLGAAAGLSQSAAMACGWFFLLPEDFSVGGVAYVMVFWTVVPLLVHGVVLRTRHHVMATGLAPLSVVYGLVFGMFAIVTVWILAEGCSYVFVAALNVAILMALSVLIPIGFLWGYDAVQRWVRVSAGAAWVATVWFGWALANAWVHGEGSGSIALGTILLASHGVFWLVYLMGMGHLGEAGPPQRLLYLRTLSGVPRVQANAALRRLVRRWGEVGEVALLAGSDSWISTAGARDLLALLTLRLGRTLVHDAASLQSAMGRLAGVRTRDGRFSSVSLSCTMPVWRSTVVELMKRCRVVLMDLRRFQSSHEGCIFEIRSLAEVTREGHLLVFLVDDTTDRPSLDAIVADAFVHGTRPTLLTLPDAASSSDYRHVVRVLLDGLRGRLPELQR